MRVYLGSPVDAVKADVCKDMPVLLSFPDVKNRPMILNDFMPTFSHVLIDSGAFSEMNSGIKIDLEEYKE